MVVLFVQTKVGCSKINVKKNNKRQNFTEISKFFLKYKNYYFEDYTQNTFL